MDHIPLTDGFSRSFFSAVNLEFIKFFISAAKSAISPIYVDFLPTEG